MFTTSAAKKAAGRRPCRGRERQNSVVCREHVQVLRFEFAVGGPADVGRHLMTSVLRSSPRIISTVGTNAAGVVETVTAWPGLGLAEALVCTGAAPFAKPRSTAVRTPGVSGAALVHRVAQRELNLAFGAGEREALGLFRIHEQRHDGDLHRLALVLVLFHARAGGEHLDVREDDVRRRVGAGFGRARGGDDITRGCPAARTPRRRRPR